MTAPLATTTVRTTSGPGLAHIVCCGDDRALCGVVVADSPWDVSTDQDCAVCVDLEQAQCERCGL